MGTDDDGVPSLVQLCYPVILQNIDQLSSLGDLSYELAKPILEHCSAEQLDGFESHYSQLQKREYRRTDAEIWKAKCYQLLGPGAEDLYTSGERRTPTKWRTEYYTLVREHETLADRASSRVRAVREARDLEQPRAVVAERLPWNGGRTGRKNNSNLTPAWRKLVSETRKISSGVFLGRHPAAAAAAAATTTTGPPRSALSLSTTPAPLRVRASRPTTQTQVHPSTSSCPTSTPRGPLPPALPPSFLSPPPPPASTAVSLSPSTSTTLSVPRRNTVRPRSSSHSGLSRVKSQPLGTPRPNLPTSHTTSRYRPY